MNAVAHVVYCSVELRDIRVCYSEPIIPAHGLSHLLNVLITAKRINSSTDIIRGAGRGGGYYQSIRSRVTDDPS